MKAPSVIVCATLAAVAAAEPLPQPAATPTETAGRPDFNPHKLANYRNDMYYLQGDIRENSMYVSMQRALASAMPSTYLAALQTNPASLAAQYRTTPPDWYSRLPQDVRGFMEGARTKQQSVWGKHMGPLPTGYAAKEAAVTGSSGGDGAKSGSGKDDGGKKSEAPAASLVGATVVALVSAFGVAALLI